LKSFVSIGSPLCLAVALFVFLGANAGYAAHSATARPAAGNQISFGPSHGTMVKTYKAFYDGHFDVYVNTDVSSKTQAKTFHINYAPVLAAAVPKSVSPEYFVIGRKAAGQRAIFGSEPPDPTYSPLWQEFLVKWKSGAKPVVLTSDNAVFNWAHKGKLTYTRTKVVINAPIIHVGK